MTEPDKPTPSLYEWAGGEPAIRRLMDCFYDRVERDDLLSPARGTNPATTLQPAGWSSGHRRGTRRCQGSTARSSS